MSDTIHFIGIGGDRHQDNLVSTTEFHFREIQIHRGGGGCSDHLLGRITMVKVLPHIDPGVFAVVAKGGFQLNG